ncbi:MAG TPA: hypothetical protein PLP29_07295 [Candidatus Ozemobacteraceae bacterium]|nr:hypothetical protein [Candidatus Ozemobacteraceae bacterium]
MTNTTPKPPIEAVGLSISRCILAIAEGRIPPGAVAKIVGGTLFENLETMWQEYSQKYWSGCTLRARTVFFQFADQKKIDQPRLRNEEPPDSAGGIWMVGDRQFETAGLKELLDLSETFLRMPVASRDELIAVLPADAMVAIQDGILKGRLKPLIPDLDRNIAGKSPDEIAQMIRDRLREYFAPAPDFSPIEVYPDLLYILQPFIRTRTADKSVVATKNQWPVAHSQIRPAIKLPDVDL